MILRIMDSPYRMAIGVFLLTLGCLMMMDPAFAQSGVGVGVTSFSCSGGHAVGMLFDSSIGCPTVLKTTNIFSFLVCNMERLAGNLLGEMFCGVMKNMLPAVLGMLSLASVFFGIGFTIGVIPATARDFQMFLLKMVFVSVFATKADYLIGTGYNLLVGGLRDGVAVGLSAMMPASAGKSQVTGIDLYQYLDKFLAQAMHYATDYIGAKAIGDDPCKNAIFAVMGLMAVAFPPIFIISLMILFRICVTFLRAIFGYIYSIIGIVFLLTLAPIFLSFYLFKQTQNFFNKWIGYLVSFSLQMVILFTFLAFVLSIDVSHVSSGLTSIVMYHAETIETTTMRAPWEYCTLCDFEIIDKSTGAVLGDTSNVNLISEGQLRCKNNPPVAIRALETAAPSQDAINSALLKFTGTALLSLLVLAYLIEYILNYVPALSSFLAGGLGASYAPQLGGGQVIGQKISMDAPGGELLDTFENTFTGTAASKALKQDGVTTALDSFKAASGALLFGGPKNAQGQGDAGLVDSFTSFILNPHRDPSSH